MNVSALGNSVQNSLSTSSTLECEECIEEIDFPKPADQHWLELKEIFLQHGFSKAVSCEILLQQSSLTSECCIKSNATLNHPGFYLTQSLIFILKKTLGSGTQSQVYLVDAINTVTNKSEEKVLKEGCKSYNREVALFTEKDHRIDHIQQSYKVTSCAFLHIAICENNGIDLAHVRFDQEKSPVFYLVLKLIDVVGGLGFLHKNGIVHRDIKPANILVGKKVCKITDTGLAIKFKPNNEEHTTYTTPAFAAPFIWKDLTFQIQQRGYQGPKTDLFSLGRTFQLLMIQLFEQKKQNLEISSLLKEIRYKRVTQPRNKISEFAEMYKGSVILLEKWSIDNVTAVLYPSEEVIYKKTLEVIKLLDNIISYNEIEGLKKLAKLAFKLQSHDIEKMPPLNLVDYKIRRILKVCKFGPSSEKSSPIKRLRKKIDFNSSEFLNNDLFEENKVPFLKIKKRLVFDSAELNQIDFLA